MLYVNPATPHIILLIMYASSDVFLISLPVLSMSPDTPLVSLHPGIALNLANIQEEDDMYFECSIKANPWIYKIVWFHEVSSLSGVYYLSVTGSTVISVGRSLPFSPNSEVSCSERAYELLNSSVSFPFCTLDFIRSGLESLRDRSFHPLLNPLVNELYSHRLSNSKRPQRRSALISFSDSTLLDFHKSYLPVHRVFRRFEKKKYKWAPASLYVSPSVLWCYEC
ncbi:hypothetical protein Pcinc_004337 [Petrolisthes cinctipes]|uniref:Ig-like domain-containing protein n=1 Tax=Petrolisthes cinctipes TaxID=88211 RepID=A0AAE1GHA4_PETCI|nr:hypothetical protein Pcinc_004337 [Petrolisthes cinctipes]